MMTKTIRTYPLSDEEYAKRIYELIIGDDIDDCDVKGAFEALQTLTEREQYVLSLRIRHLQTQKIVGQKIGVSIARVGQIEHKALRKLRHPPLNRLISKYKRQKWLSEQEKLKNRGVVSMDLCIEEVNFSTRAYHCLKRIGIDTVRDLYNKTSKDMTGVRNLGRKSLDEIIQVMQKLGFEDWPLRKGADEAT